MSVVDELVPIAGLQLPDKEQAVKMLARLEQGANLASSKLNAITEVTADNREAVIAELSTIKQIHDKIRSIREPLTKWLDEKKQQLMSFERESDYKDKDSLYTEKRNLVQQFDQQVLAETRKREADAERQRKIGVYLAEVRAGVQRQLVDMVTFKKRQFIDNFSKWQASLTFDNLDAKVAALTSKSPVLDQADYDRCFNTSFGDKMNILSIEQESELQNSGFEYKDIVAKRAEINTRLHKEYIDGLKPEFPYAKYNEEYVLDVSLKINEFRAGIEATRATLKQAKDNAEAEAARQKQIQAEAAAQTAKVNEAKNQQLEQVSAAKDSGVMEAEFVKQAQTQDLPQGPVKKVVTIAQSQFFKAFIQIIEACVKHPEFSVYKKGKSEHHDGVQWWLNFYAGKCQIEERVDGELRPVISGVVITEEAKTTVRAK